MMGPGPSPIGTNLVPVQSDQVYKLINLEDAKSIPDPYTSYYCRNTMPNGLEWSYGIKMG